MGRNKRRRTKDVLRACSVAAEKLKDHAEALDRAFARMSEDEFKLVPADFRGTPKALRDIAGLIKFSGEDVGDLEAASWLARYGSEIVVGVVVGVLVPVLQNWAVERPSAEKHECVVAVSQTGGAATASLDSLVVIVNAANPVPSDNSVRTADDHFKAVADIAGTVQALGGVVSQALAREHRERLLSHALGQMADESLPPAVRLMSASEALGVIIDVTREGQDGIGGKNNDNEQLMRIEALALTLSTDQIENDPRER